MEGGGSYSGDWVEDKKDGKGKYVWGDGDVYEGEWKEGRRNGTGSYIWKNGN